MNWIRTNPDIAFANPPETFGYGEYKIGMIFLAILQATKDKGDLIPDIGAILGESQHVTTLGQLLAQKLYSKQKSLTADNIKQLSPKRWRSLL